MVIKFLRYDAIMKEVQKTRTCIGRNINGTSLVTNAMIDPAGSSESK